MHVQIVLFDGFDLLDVIAPFEVFTAAAAYTNGEISIELVSAEGARMVTSGVNQLKLQTTSKIDLTHKGVIIIPGASGSLDDGPDSIPVILKQATETELSSFLKEAMKIPDILVSTICGGSLILALDGLLDGRHAVTHHLGMELLNATNATAINARIVDDGDLISGGGVTSGLDLALYLIEREIGPRIAHAVEQLFEYERRGTVWKNTGMAPKESQLSKATEQKINPINHQTTDEFQFQGKWETTISTPLGEMPVLFDFAYLDGRIIGTATQGDDVIILDRLTLEEDCLKGAMKINKPMRLSLKFSVFVKKNQLCGEVKAGMLPASKLTGQRIL
ncbi:hypothetical protein J6TS2_37940 [Heyndrickxia sporothermodurans]|nr:hypothetical protein J6TS2_37940 [Heyndrickxia sporothermodurans]